MAATQAYDNLYPRLNRFVDHRPIDPDDASPLAVALAERPDHLTEINIGMAIAKQFTATRQSPASLPGRLPLLSINRGHLLSPSPHGGQAVRHQTPERCREK